LCLSPVQFSASFLLTFHLHWSRSAIDITLLSLYICSFYFELLVFRKFHFVLSVGLTKLNYSSLWRFLLDASMHISTLIEWCMLSFSFSSLGVVWTYCAGRLLNLWQTDQCEQIATLWSPLTSIFIKVTCGSRHLFLSF
jgi:hypothetical protein